MEGTFGPKREIWHTVPLPPRDSSDHSGSPKGEGTAATRKVKHTEIAVSPEDNIELRRLRLTNRTREACTVEVTTYAEVQRAPFEMAAPVLRVTPHVDTTAEDLDTFADALTAATAEV